MPTTVKGTPTPELVKPVEKSQLFLIPAWQVRMQQVSFDAADLHDTQVMQIVTKRHSGTLQPCVQ